MSAVAVPPRPAAVAARIGTRRLELVALGGILAIGLFLRLWDLGAQSFWHDEVDTVIMVRGSAGSAISHMLSTEFTPPLYFALAFVWTHVLGTGETQLRTLSLLAGWATIGVTWAMVREVSSARAALMAAALVATNPVMIWFSQEARSYALMILLTSVALLYALRLRRTGARRDLVGWAVAASLAMLTHYFAAFVLLPQAWLVWGASPGVRHQAKVALGAVLGVCVALAPLAYHQINLTNVDGRPGNWIAAIPIGNRVSEVLRELAFVNTDLISSNSAAPQSPFRWIALAAVALALLGALTATRDERRAMGPLALVGAVGLLLPLVLYISPFDTFKDRNLLAVWPPLLAVMAVSLAGRRMWAAGAVAVLLVSYVGADVQRRVIVDPALQRKDWRGLGRTLDRPATQRVVAMVPTWGYPTLQFYGHDLRRTTGSHDTRELVLTGDLGPLGPKPPKPPPGFRQVEDRQIGALWIVRYRSPVPRPVNSATFPVPNARLMLEG